MRKPILGSDLRGLNPEAVRQRQWGEFAPGTFVGDDDMVQVGGRAAGRVLDGRDWSQFPEAGRP